MALSDYDWTDVLVGDMPHFYIYTINNIGEGIIAKRRSYATLVTHLTAPFMQSELYDELKILKDRIHRIENMEESSVKQNYRETITEMAARQNILSALDIDSTRTLTDADIDRVHIYLEEIDGAKVNDGLYTLGVPYSDENLRNTARLMSIDPIRYSLASLDAAKGLIDNDRLDDIAFINHRYGAATENAIARALAGGEPRPAAPLAGRRGGHGHARSGRRGTTAAAGGDDANDAHDGRRAQKGAAALPRRTGEYHSRRTTGTAGCGTGGPAGSLHDGDDGAGHSRRGSMRAAKNAVRNASCRH